MIRVVSCVHDCHSIGPQRNLVTFIAIQSTETVLEGVGIEILDHHV